MALGLESGRVMLVDEATGEVKWAVEAHIQQSSSTQVAMSLDGRFVASVGLYDPHWKLWDAASGAVHMVGATHGTGACICAVPEAGAPVLQAGCPLVAHIGGLKEVAFSPCGGRFATGGIDGAVILWDVQTGQAERCMVEVHPEGIVALSFSASGARLVSGDEDGSIFVWDTATGSLLFRMPEDLVDQDGLSGWDGGAGGHLESLHFSPTNENRLAIATWWGASMWDVGQGENIWSTTDAGRFGIVSPDGRTFATATGVDDGDVQLFNADSGELLLTVGGSERAVLCAAFSVDGSQLASGSRDGTCRVWDSSTGALLRTIVAGTPVFSVASGRDWVRDTQSAMAFAMGHHPRLGAGSLVLELEVGVVRMIVDRA